MAGNTRAVWTKSRAGRLAGVMVMAAAGVLAAAPGRPALAHQGGALQVNLAKMTVTPAGPSMWHAVLLLQDQDSGTPAWGMDVTLSGTGPAGAVLAPVRLTGDGKGDYDGHFEGPAGAWRFAVHADPTPGGQVALTFDTSRELALKASGVTTAGHSSGHGSGGGGSGAGPEVLGVILAAVVAVGAAFLVMRRRAMVPDVR